MTPFLAISLIISIVLIILFLTFFDSEAAFIFIVLLIIQGIIGYGLVGNTVTTNVIEHAAPIAEFEIVKGKDRVFLIKDGKTLREFIDARTVLINEYKTVTKREFINGYNNPIQEKTEYTLE